MVFSTTTSADETEQYIATKRDKLCEWLEKKGPVGKFVSQYILRHLTINAPVILAFVTLCSLVYVVTATVGGQRVLGVHDTWNTFRTLQYSSLLTHIFAHSGWGHLKGNVTHLLLVGPAVEHEFGSRNLILIILIVAIVSAFAHIVLGNRRSHQLGASGVVFACILLSSLVSAGNGKVPVAFVLIFMLYMGEELALFFNFWNPDGVSHHAHLTGGLVGAVAGIYIHRQRRQEKTSSIVQQWKKLTTKKKK